MNSLSVHTPHLLIRLGPHKTKYIIILFYLCSSFSSVQVSVQVLVHFCTYLEVWGTNLWRSTVTPLRTTSRFYNLYRGWRSDRSTVPRKVSRGALIGGRTRITNRTALHLFPTISICFQRSFYKGVAGKSFWTARNYKKRGLNRL